jgi:hypothetical protein
MIDQIKILATPAFLPSQYAFRADAYLGFACVLVLEQSPPVLAVQNGEAWDKRPASEAELAAILSGLQANPPKPQHLTPLEALERFTVSERAAIEANAKPLAWRLFSAIEPISWATFAASVAELQSGGLLTSAQAERILS